MKQWTRRLDYLPPRLESLEGRLAPGDTILGTLMGAAWLGTGAAATSPASGTEAGSPTTAAPAFRGRAEETASSSVVTASDSPIGTNLSEAGTGPTAGQSSPWGVWATGASLPDLSNLQPLATAERSVMAGTLADCCCCCGATDGADSACADPAADPALGLTPSAVLSTGLEAVRPPVVARDVVHAGQLPGHKRGGDDSSPPLCDDYNPTITSWVINQTGETGHSPDPTIDAVVSRIQADVQHVYYNATDVYIQATGIPSYGIGPFPGNPNTPAEQDYTFRIPQDPQPGSGTVATPLGPIGVLVNGVVIFNPLDGHSYQNRNVWHQNAGVVEAPSFDAALGHPEMHGIYHHHELPVSLSQQLGDDGTRHSPILGFAFDGFPIYGPYGYASPDGTGGIVPMVSSYQLRDITTRTTLPDGTQLPPNLWGPPVSDQYPLGYYAEDYVYVPGSGTLDEFNGRFTVTPDYPNGTFAYFATIDGAGQPAYPYLVGPTYYGDVAQDDLHHNVQIPDDVTEYIP